MSTIIHVVPDLPLTRHPPPPTGAGRYQQAGNDASQQRVWGAPRSVSHSTCQPCLRAAHRSRSALTCIEASAVWCADDRVPRAGSLGGGMPYWAAPLPQRFLTLPSLRHRLAARSPRQASSLCCSAASTAWPSPTQACACSSSSLRQLSWCLQTSTSLPSYFLVWSCSMMSTSHWAFRSHAFALPPHPHLCLYLCAQAFLPVRHWRCARYGWRVVVWQGARAHAGVCGIVVLAWHQGGRQGRDASTDAGDEMPHELLERVFCFFASSN